MTESNAFSTALGGDVVFPVTGSTVFRLRQEIMQRNGLIKALVGNLAAPGESWEQVLHRCGFANSSPGFKVAMEIATTHDD